MDVEFWVSVAVLAYALVIGGWLGVITVRSTRGTTFMEAMIQTSFLPEKRRRYLSIISIEGGAILLAGIVWGLSEAGMPIGTPYYISPEQVRGQNDVDIRADLYSLGATLYHAITGHVPFDAPTPEEVVLAQVQTPLTPPNLAAILEPVRAGVAQW